MEGCSLKENDRKLIAALDGRSKTSINKLAKALNGSKDGVNYRLKKLFNQKIITRCFAEVNIPKLGLVMGKVNLQFQNLNEVTSNQLFNYLTSLPQVPWVVYCSGRWDCICGFFVTDNHEILEILNNLSEKYGAFILSKEVLIEPEYYIVSRGWLIENTPRTIARIGGKVEWLVDELDKKIIKRLAENSRTPIIDLAINLDQSSNTIINRIKNLEKKGVIQNYPISLDLKKIGMEFCKAFVYLQNRVKEKYQRLVNYCLKHPNVTAISCTIGAWEMEIEMEVHNLDEFYRIMNDLKTKFSDVIRNYEAVTITKEYGRDYNKIL